MKASEVYLRAAKRISDGRNDRSCQAVAEAEGGCVYDKTAARVKYVEAMLGTEVTFELFRGENMSIQQEHDVRVLALLFMHQIALDEERGK